MITDRDRSVVRWVAVIGAASAGDVMARFRLGRTAGYRRLAALVEHQLLTRSRLVYGQPALYTATREGLAWAGTPQVEPARVGVATTRHWATCAGLAVRLERIEVIFLISVQISKVTLHPPDGPYDTPLGPNLRQTGVALDLVLFKLIGVIGPALMGALVAGDIVAGEDMGGTLKTIVPRSLRRGPPLAGKALALVSYSVAALAAYLVIGEIAGGIAWGLHPLVDLSGQKLSGAGALGLSVVAMAVYALPVLAIAAFGFFLWVVTRQSVAAIAGTLLYALALQGLSALSAIAPARPYLLANQLTAFGGTWRSRTRPSGEAAERRSWRGRTEGVAVYPGVARLAARRTGGRAEAAVERNS